MEKMRASNCQGNDRKENEVSIGVQVLEDDVENIYVSKNEEKENQKGVTEKWAERGVLIREKGLIEGRWDMSDERMNGSFVERNANGINREKEVNLEAQERED